MSAAQNPVDQIVDIANGLPAGLVDLVSALPEPVRSILVGLVVARLTMPSLLRAVDNTLFERKVRRTIDSAEDLKDVMRIRSQPRRWFERREGSEPPDDSPKSAGGGDRRTGARDDEPPEDVEDNPP